MLSKIVRHSIKLVRPSMPRLVRPFGLQNKVEVYRVSYSI